MRDGLGVISYGWQERPRAASGSDVEPRVDGDEMGDGCQSARTMSDATVGTDRHP